MSVKKTTLLIVEDEEPIRNSLSQLFTELGYSVQHAPDGFAALGEVRRSLPDILLSDLNMPRMSGFALLPVIRRCFPAVQLVAMSGMFSGTQVPPGVVADAFYEKGSDLSRLMQLVATMANSDRTSLRPQGTLAIF